MAVYNSIMIIQYKGHTHAYKLFHFKQIQEPDWEPGRANFTANSIHVRNYASLLEKKKKTGSNSEHNLHNNPWRLIWINLSSYVVFTVYSLSLCY